MEYLIGQVDEGVDQDPAGDLDAELAQLTDVESLVANIYASSCSTNSTAVCSGGICCF
jgi:hypothetical protein